MKWSGMDKDYVDVVVVDVGCLHLCLLFVRALIYVCMCVYRCMCLNV